MNAHSVTFDKLVYLDRLKLAGVPEDVARAHAEGLDQALRDFVATKSDLEKSETALRSDLSALRSDLEKTGAALRSDLSTLRSDLEKTGTALRSDLEKVETKLDAKIDTTAAVLRAEIAASKNSVLIWTFSFNVALVGAIFAIVKFVH